MTRAHRLLSSTVLAALAGATLSTAGATAGVARPTLMLPTGGGYEPAALEAFGRAAIERSGDDTVDIVVVPSAYGDAIEDRPENIALAQQRTDEVEAACNIVVAEPKRCVGTLAILLSRADAMNPDASAALRRPSLDGIYILGGDQGLAMQVLANSPAERAVTAGVLRGAALGGTSAGAAVESRSMINGYVGDYGPAQGLRKGSTLVWWGDDGDPERGLANGSTRAIYDQHFFQRGRFGRSLGTIASADERMGGKSPVGVGADYATGVRNTGDRMLSRVFGESAVATIDFESLGATHSWVGVERWLSARKVKVNLLTENTTYDLVTRRMTRGGAPTGAVAGRAWKPPVAPGSGTLYLGGGILGGGKVMPSVVADGKDASSDPGDARMLVLSADTASTAAEYGDRAKRAGWTGRIDQATYGQSGWAAVHVASYDVVVIAAIAPPKVAIAMRDSRFRTLIRHSVMTVPVVLADGPMAATVGRWWSPQARPDVDDYEDKAIAAFKVGEAHWQAGLGAVDVNVIPAINTDYQWGRLFNAAAAAPSHLALGVSAGSAIRLHANRVGVVDGSVVVADGRDATTWTSRNGTLGAAGIVLDIFGPGERLGR